MRLAWLSPRWPFPPDDGAKVASASLLEALAAEGHEISLVAIHRGPKRDPSPSPLIREAFRHELKAEAVATKAIRVLGSLIDAVPVSAMPFSRVPLSWHLLRQPLSGAPDALVVDGAHAFAALPPPPCPWPIVYRAHNVEAALWEQAAARSSFPARAYFELQASRMRRFEGKLIASSRAVAAISEEDARDFAARYPGARATCVPVGFRFSSALAPPPAPLTLGWLGRMDWPPNREGLAWFLHEIWPAVSQRRPDARLLLAGSGDASWLPGEPGRGVERLGRVADVAAFYGRIHAAIAPVPFGSGTKIKVIEAARYGRAAFATPEAFRGSGLGLEEAALVSAEKAEWIEALAGAHPESLARTGKLAYSRAETLFDARAAAAKFLSLLR